MKPLPQQEWIVVASPLGSAHAACSRCGHVPQAIAAGDKCPRCTPIYEGIEEVQQAVGLITDSLENLTLAIKAINRNIRDLRSKT